MHHSWQFAVTSDLKGLPTGLSEVESAGGTAHLIGDNTQLIPFAVEAEHGEGKVLAHGADHPAGAKDQPPSSCSKNALDRRLSSSFAGAVNT